MAEAAALMGQRIVWVDLEVRGRGEPESRGENREGGRQGGSPGGLAPSKTAPGISLPRLGGGLDLRVRLLPGPLLNGGVAQLPPFIPDQWGAGGVPGVCML